MSTASSQLPVIVAGGGIGGLAAALALGAAAVWVGTRLLASDEATATTLHKQTLVKVVCFACV